MRDTLYDVMAADVSGRSKGLTAAQRAAKLVSSGKPSLDHDQDDSDDENQYGDSDFGIVPTK